jgi:hypothetical protein
MEIKDKRLVTKLTQHEQTSYDEKISINMPDAKDLYEEILIEHEPIKLLEKITSKKNHIEKPVFKEPEPTDNETS